MSELTSLVAQQSICILFSCRSSITTVKSVIKIVSRAKVKVMPKDFKKWYSALLLGSHHKKDFVENKLASLLVVSLGNVVNGIPPSLCGRQVAG